MDPFGSETIDAVVNVRFIAATNRDPKIATEEGILTLVVETSVSICSCLARKEW